VTQKLFYSSMAFRMPSVIVLVLALVSCVPGASERQIINRIPFPEAEYAQLALTGTAIVRGQAFLKTRGGDVKTAAGNEIILYPVTSYSEQWFNTAYISGNELTEADSRQQKYTRGQVADGNGRFTFKNVPAGKYYAIASVYWQTATGYKGQLEWQGGLIVKLILVGVGEELDVIITR
jgi:hypothetical protein